MQPENKFQPNTQPEPIRFEEPQQMSGPNTEIVPQINPSNATSSPVFSKILPLAGIIIASISLILSIASLATSSQNNQPSDSVDDTDTTSDIVAGTFESQPIRISCNLPKSTDDIVYLYLSTNSGETGIFVSPEGNIESFTRGSSDTGDVLTTTKNVETDTSDIFKQLLDDGINNFSSYEYPGYSEGEGSEEAASWSWLAQIDNSDSSSCEARGNDTPPVWFKDLEKLIESKFNQ